MTLRYSLFGQLSRGASSLLTIVAILLSAFSMVPTSLAEEDMPKIIYTFGREHCEKCRSYSVKLYSTGRVVFEGTVQYYELPPSASYTTEHAIRETTVQAESMSSWIDVLTRQGFLSLSPHYTGDQCAMDDRSTQSLTLFASGSSKTVIWIGCPESEAPMWLREVVTSMRKQVNPEQWLKVLPNPHIKVR